jgi:EAL domain-containing protein (putative c-di-GMP-specific phosphodiesterase class I)
MKRRDIKVFRDGDLIFREGDLGECAYLIERGKVLFFITNEHGEQILNVAGSGEVFGEMSLIDSYPRSASCRAVGDVELIVVTKVQLTDRISSADSIVRLLMRSFLQRLRRNIDLLHGERAPNLSSHENLEREKSEAASRIELESRIFNAVEENQFIPHYQPIYDLNERRIIGCEALIRWIAPGGDMVPPSVFMDILEDSASIVRVGNQMIEKCMRDLGTLLAEYGPEFFVSINVSGRQFEQAGFLDALEEIRMRYGADSKRIKLEITERIMMGGPRVLEVLNACRRAGYSLAIDDFGTGFSSLQYLAAMPLQDLKIDRAFIRQMLDDAKYLAIVKSLVQMAGALGLDLIAEGIETEAELELVKSLGVTKGQGFLFAKALPLKEFLKKSPKTGRLKAA